MILSSVATLWLALQGAYLPMLLINLVFYGVVTRSRMTLTQAMIADSIAQEDIDAAFSVFFLLGVASAPFWALLVGYLMQQFGFTLAFFVLGFSYIFGIILMLFVKESKPASETVAAT